MSIRAAKTLARRTGVSVKYLDRHGHKRIALAGKGCPDANHPWDRRVAALAAQDSRDLMQAHAWDDMQHLRKSIRGENTGAPVAVYPGMKNETKKALTAHMVSQGWIAAAEFVESCSEEELQEVAEHVGFEE